MKFLVNRLVVFLTSLVMASLLIFGALNMLGGDAASVLLDQAATPEALEALRRDLNLDRPLHIQYLDWIGGVVVGDFGTSLVSRAEIAPQVWPRLAVTVPLALFAILIVVSVSIPMGIFLALRNDKLSGVAATALTQVGLALPAFWAGILLSMLFAVRLGWLPSGGFERWGTSWTGALRSLLLPAISLSIIQSAILIRYVRSSILEVMREDYVRTARAKGMTWKAALWRHGLKNASLPSITVIGLQIGSMVGGTVIIETVFSLPGLGRMILQGINGRDFLLVQAAIFVLTGFILLLNLLTDFAYRLLDPRIGS